ncbi:DUF4145 domain-containing protein [Bacillus infantis]|uniref:DUF4145 domain-containing protein n=1 Tax=Bacillus infantis TaxID=324767 RepID=UPI00344E0B81
MEDQLKNLDKKVYCSNCKGRRNHKILMTFKEVSEPIVDFNWFCDYHVVMCLGCDTKAFVKQYGDEFSFEYNMFGEREFIDEFTVYPEEPKELTPEQAWLVRHKRQPKKFEHAPENISSLYNQIIESFNNRHMILAISGLRTLLEGICSHLGIKKGFIYDDKRNKILNKEGQPVRSKNLGARINELVDQGHIIFAQALVLHKVKDIGNNAIHDIEVPKLGTIKDIISIVEDVMNSIFELKNHKLLKHKKKEQQT